MQRRIERGRDFARGYECETMAEWRQQVLASPKMRAMMKSLGWRYTGQVASGAMPVAAMIRQARWLAVCECGGAERVDPDEPTFYCFSCGNELVGGDLRAVVFPEDIQEIEAVLSARPFPINRNWEPGESLQDLVEENRSHGVDIADD